MTVKELIEKLSHFPDDYVVVLDLSDYVADIKEVKQETTPDFDTETGNIIGEIKFPNVLIVEA